MFEKECAELKEKASELDNRIQDTENTFSKQKQELDENRVVLKEYRSMLMDKVFNWNYIYYDILFSICSICIFNCLTASRVQVIRRGSGKGNIKNGGERR